jgi:hypothetical protein
MRDRLREWQRMRRIAADWKRKSQAITEAQEHRGAMLAGQEATVARVEALLFRHDPIGINFEHNTDEYRAEAETICLRRDEARTPEDLRRIVHEEFVRWFDAKTAGPEVRYEPIAEEIWDVWRPRNPD